MSKWLWQLKWAFVIAIVAGPVFAYINYTDMHRIQRVMNEGSLYDAAVAGGEVIHHRRGPDEYKINTGWLDEAGNGHNAVLQVSTQFAAEIFDGADVVIDHTQIKAMPGEPDNTAIVAPDADQQLFNRTFNFWISVIASILGVIVTPIVFVWEARARRSRDADIDATLAEIRARNA